jgi:transposase
LHRHLPLYFKLFPGSISDVVTLKNLVAEVKALGISKSLFILDRGFYSENNIKEMSDANIDFIIPLPFSVNVGKGLISETNREIESPANAKRFGGDIFYVLESEIRIGDVDAYGYVLFNKKREGLETNSFYIDQSISNAPLTEKSSEIQSTNSSGLLEILKGILSTLWKARRFISADE